MSEYQNYSDQEIKQNLLQEMGIIREERIAIFHWLLEVKNIYGFNDITALNSLKLYDRFCLMNKGLVVAPMHALIAMVCLCLSVKMHENCILDFE
jgi:hypothetical protein